MGRGWLRWGSSPNRRHDMCPYKRVALPVSLMVGFAGVVVAGAQELDSAKTELRSALTASDRIGSSTPSSITGIGRPPRVGPNVQVNDVQQAAPDGLLGRSE